MYGRLCFNNMKLIIWVKILIFKITWRPLIRQLLNFSKNFKITAMKNKFDETPSNPGWEFLTDIPFKTLIAQHQHWLTLRHMKKKMIWNPFKKESFHQFNVDYMTHTYLKKRSTHREQVIKVFSIIIQISHIKVYQKWVTKK